MGHDSDENWDPNDFSENQAQPEPLETDSNAQNLEDQPLESDPNHHIVSEAYEFFLNREGGADEIKAWSASLENGTSLQDLLTATFRSDEVQSQYNLSSMENNEFVQFLYQFVVHRDGDPGGVEHWENQIATGAYTREEVFLIFCGSDEFQNLNPELAIDVQIDPHQPDTSLPVQSQPSPEPQMEPPQVEGDENAASEIDNSRLEQLTQPDSALAANEASQTDESAMPEMGAYQSSTGFDPKAVVTDAYQVFLGRQGEADGVLGWTESLNAGTSVDQLVVAIFRSDEGQRVFNADGLSDESFIKSLYEKLVGREGDSSGVDHWLHQLATGQESREDVFLQFCASQEFRNLHPELAIQAPVETTPPAMSAQAGGPVEAATPGPAVPHPQSHSAEQPTQPTAAQIRAAALKAEGEARHSALQNAESAAIALAQQVAQESSANQTSDPRFVRGPDGDVVASTEYFREDGGGLLVLENGDVFIGTYQGELYDAEHRPIVLDPDQFSFGGNLDGRILHHRTELELKAEQAEAEYQHQIMLYTEFKAERVHENYVKGLDGVSVHPSKFSELESKMGIRVESFYKEWEADGSPTGPLHYIATSATYDWPLVGRGSVWGNFIYDVAQNKDGTFT